MQNPIPLEPSPRKSMAMHDKRGPAPGSQVKDPVCQILGARPTKIC